MATRRQIERECAKRNRARGVKTGGTVTCEQFCRTLSGSVLISGTADWLTVKECLVREYVERKDMATIVLTGDSVWKDILNRATEEGRIRGYMVSDPQNLTFHALCGLRPMQILDLIELAADECRITKKDEVFIYAEGFLAVLQSVYSPNLPAMLCLAKECDDRICEIGKNTGVPDDETDKIRGNREAGQMFRRLLVRLQKVFESVSDETCSSYYCLFSGVLAEVPFMVFYQHSCSQTVMNRFLKEELENTRKRCGPFRVILDETCFVSEQDELLEYLMKQMRLGNLEVVACGRNVPDMLKDDRHLGNFQSIAVFSHDSDLTTERITETFGKYLHHEVVVGGGKPSVFSLPINTEVHYSMQATERLKVRGEDLKPEYGKLFGRGFQVAVKRGAPSAQIELVSVETFQNIHYKQKKEQKL